jgi:superfamily II DNA/RNA helicase
MPPVLPFADLGLPAPLTRVLADLGITTPTPIQAATLPDSLRGRDVLGRGRTGSGKTYAFLLPLVARLSAQPRRTANRQPRALILAPTRELVSQIESSLKPLADSADLTSVVVFGGVSQQPQVRALRSGVDIVIACPGRLEDLIQQRALQLSSVEITVVDEADHMADLGFLPPVQRLMRQTPANGQRLLFSATLDAKVAVLVKQFLRQPVTHEVNAVDTPVQTMAHHVLHIGADQHLSILADLTSAPGRTVVFTRTKHRAKALTRQLQVRGIPAVELHGNLSQRARERSMDAFHSGRVETLVATDIAARGIHVDDVELVVHADPPVEHKAYLHRSGRTARAGKRGTVVTLMTDSQRGDVQALTRAAGVRPTTTRVNGPQHPILVELAPGERRLQAPIVPDRAPSVAPPRRNGSRVGTEAGRSSRTRSSAVEERSPAARPSRSPQARQRVTAPASESPTRSHSAAAFSGRTRRG